VRIGEGALHLAELDLGPRATHCGGDTDVSLGLHAFAVQLGDFTTRGIHDVALRLVVFRH
jgi:hypothetical protein